MLYKLCKLILGLKIIIEGVEHDNWNCRKQAWKTLTANLTLATLLPTSLLSLILDLLLI